MKNKMNKIHNLDCLEFMKEVPDNYIDLVLTDPPYKFEVHKRGIAQKRDYLKNGFKRIGSHAEYDIYNQGFLEECVRICKKPNIFVFCNKSQILDILKKADELKLNFEIIIFAKTAPTPLTNNQWLPDKEYGIHIFKNMKVFGNYSTKKSFYLENSFKDTSIQHPTAKPIKIISNIIKNLTDENNIVLDTFLGSGTTVNACINLNRQYIGIEIDEEYYKIACEREQKAKGKWGLFA